MFSHLVGFLVRSLLQIEELVMHLIYYSYSFSLELRISRFCLHIFMGSSIFDKGSFLSHLSRLHL